MQLFAVIAALLLVSAAGHAQSRAFPGAEGFGARTLGGRFGEVVAVTNLNDSGVGSLRDALTRDLEPDPDDPDPPRIIVFRVGGTIDIAAPLRVDYPFVTIAGQTAPGGGIQLRRTPSFPEYRHLLVIATHDVVVRHLRLRPGRVNAKCDQDAIQIDGPSYNVVIDHTSFSWGTDELMELGDPTNVHDVTVQWSIFSEALYESNPDPLTGGCPLIGNPPDQRRLSMGFLGSSPPTTPPTPPNTGPQNISLHHNVFAFNFQRNPKIVGQGIWDVVNNVVYNPGSILAEVDDQLALAPLQLNWVANYADPSVHTLKKPIWMKLLPGGQGISLWLDRNVPGTDILECNGTPCPPSFPLARHPAPAVTTTFPALSGPDPGAPIRNVVLAGVGATRPARDSVDACIVAAVTNDTLQNGGESDGFLEDPAEGCGPWPALASGSPPVDTDGDGMPDSFETQYGYEPNDPADGPTDWDGDCWTTVEEYLNGTHPNTVDGGSVETSWLESVAAQDGYLRESADDSGYGGGAFASPLRVGDDVSNREFRSIVSFATAAPVPDSAHVCSGVLSIWSTTAPVGNPETLLPIRVVAPMPLGTVFSGNSALQAVDFHATSTPESEAPAMEHLLPFNSWRLPVDGAWVSKTGTTQLRAWIDDDDEDAGNDYYRIESGEWTGASGFKPLLKVVYQPEG